MRIEYDVKLDFKDVLLKPKRSRLSSRKEVDINRTFTFLNGVSWTGLPLIASNMSTVGTLGMHKALRDHNVLTCLHKHITLPEIRHIAESEYEDSLILSCGANIKEFKIIQQYMCVLPKLKFICIDVANGYMKSVLDTIEYVKSHYPERVLIAGNVVTPEATEALILAGADIVKVGIGSGAACTTRVQTGVGMPQLSAIIECADAAHGLDGRIISDGGCSTPGDIVKAYAAGADFVMLGGMLAGHSECGGEITKDGNGNMFVEFYGMSSKKANENFSGGLKSYRASEGRELLIPFKGSVHDTMQEIEGGLRSACTYLGAKKLKELTKRATFVRVNNQVNESLKQYEVK